MMVLVFSLLTPIGRAGASGDLKSSKATSGCTRAFDIGARSRLSRLDYKAKPETCEQYAGRGCLGRARNLPNQDPQHRD
ncbi:hypothetical protein A7K73_02420 [Candidatus Methylacidiphilum fumarolicum]|nr:hypothetical protein A7K73_02420 [Candidatus Methylacidiphilum fumarolicum]TFE75877.1 hypothetical protein A7D33_01055 [Candidatus Methylacidiphilum fumarolicum]